MVESGRSHQGGQRLFIRDCNMKPDLLGERERASGKFHWAQTAVNRMDFYENCADITEIL